MSKEVIVTLSDKNFIPQAMQLFSSIYHNSGWKGDYLILYQGKENDDLRWFRDKGIIVKSFSEITSRSFAKHPPTVLGKFHLFTPEFKRWEKVLYLDADIIVEASLYKLKTVEGFNAVPDIHFKTLGDQFNPRGNGLVSSRKKLYENLNRIYDVSEPAFNTGVMAFDTDIIKNFHIFDSLMDLYNKYKSIANSDQSILNLFFLRNWNRLPLVYNNYFPYQRVAWKPRYVHTNSIIQHFLWDKPWTRNDRYYDKIWRNNLSSAQYIDLSARIEPKKVWSDDEIIKQERILKSLNHGTGPIKKFFYGGVDRIDDTLGKIGNFTRGFHNQ